MTVIHQPVTKCPVARGVPALKSKVETRVVTREAADSKRFVAACEAEYHARIEALCDTLLREGRHIVMLTGASAAGKTTCARKISGTLQERGVRSDVVSLDDFYIGEGRYPKRPDGSDDYECLEALDLPVLHSCLRQLNETGCCTAPVFDFKTQLPSGSRQVDCRDGVVVIEGLHALNPALSALLPRSAVLRVYAGLREEYTDAEGKLCLNTRDIRLARRLVRDYRSRNHAAEFTLNLWDEVCDGERRYIVPYKPQADYLLNTSHRYEVCLWRRELASLPAHEPEAACALAALRSKFSVFPELDVDLVPSSSMLCEFINAEQ